MDRPVAISASLEKLRRSASEGGGSAHNADADDLSGKKLLRTSTIGGGSGSRAFEGSFGYMNSMLHGSNLMIVMVGLPARGKSFLAKKISRYLNWVGVQSKVFNVGQYRRQHLGADKAHFFFADENETGKKQRREMAERALEDATQWLKEDISHAVVVFDATNSTRARRELIISRCAAEKIEIMFIESICNDQSVIEKNVLLTKLNMPDYEKIDDEKAIADFLQRIKHYEQRYEPLDAEFDADLSWMKIIDVGRTMVLNRIQSYVPCRISFLMQHLRITPRKLWLTRHGESEYNRVKRLGGNAPLTPAGREYSKALHTWIKEQVHAEEEEENSAGGKVGRSSSGGATDSQESSGGAASASRVTDANSAVSLTVWTSTLRRTIETAEPFSDDPDVLVLNMPALDEIDAGSFDGWTYEQIQREFPEEYAARQANKLHYRYFRGESYVDVIARLESTIFELERMDRPILVVGHQAILRVLLSYFLEVAPEQAPFLSVPLHTVIELTPGPYGAKKREVKLT